MSENEKRLTRLLEELSDKELRNAAGGALVTRARTTLDALLAEHRAEVERRDSAAHEAIALAGRQARDAALEEAASEGDKEAATAKEHEATSAHHEEWRVWGRSTLALASRIRALKTRPAERHLPESRVREALNGARAVACSDVQYAYGWNEALRTAGRRLGINLDAPATLSERVATSQAKTEKPCTCGDQPHHPNCEYES